MLGFLNFANSFWLRRSSGSIEADLNYTRRRCILRYDARQHFDRLLCVSKTADNPTSLRMRGQPQGRSKQLRRGAFAQCSTRLCPAVFEQTTDSYDIDNYRSNASQTHCSRTPPPGATISVHRHLQHRMVGAGRSPWQRNCKPMKDCHSYSSRSEPLKR
jgi:hypothetical protein